MRNLLTGTIALLWQGAEGSLILCISVFVDLMSPAKAKPLYEKIGLFQRKLCLVLQAQMFRKLFWFDTG